MISDELAWERSWMEPVDDPEARIRKLEQPLADASGATGLGDAAPPPKGPGRFRPWMLVGRIVVFLLLGVGVYYTGGWTREGVTTTSPSSPSAGGASVTSLAPGGYFSISGVRENHQIRCTLCSVRIDGSYNTVTITGHAANLTVSGSHNVVTIDTAQIIWASGYESRVTYRYGSPQIYGPGTVERG